MAETHYQQFASIFSHKADGNLIDWEVNPDNEEPTDQHKNDYEEKIEGGATFLAVKQVNHITPLTGETIKLWQPANLKLEAIKPWEDIKGDIPFQAYDTERSDFKSEIEENNRKSCVAAGEFEDYGGMFSSQAAPLVTSKFWGSSRVHFEKVGFNVLEPGASIHGKTNSSNYATFKPFGTEPKIFVGKRDQPPVVVIEGKKITSSVKVIVNVDPLQTEVTGDSSGNDAMEGKKADWQNISDTWMNGSRLKEHEADDEKADKLIDLEIGDMIAPFKKIEKVGTNLIFMSPLGVAGIRG